MYATSRNIGAAALALIGLAACSTAEAGNTGHVDHAHPEAPTDASVPLYDNLGDHGRTITADAAAAPYFDQGLRLQYAFNHAEAIRSYEAALEADPDCAMCYWGIALALGPNINGAMDAASGARAYEAIGEAARRAGGASPVEQALIGALQTRYAADPAAGRAALDSAYADAMADVVEQFPSDDDVLTLYAAARMNLRPWDYWRGEYGARVPNPGTELILASLEKALEIDDRNPGACHYYIHAVEAAFPERAVSCADRLAALMPGAGHIVHMPGHIYIRVGRYADAVRANEHAVHSDETYIADQSPMGVYPAAYYPHNYHFMAFAATMAGMGDRAMEASEIVAPKVPKAVALEVTWIQNAVVFPQLTGVSFGRWADVLARPLPDPELHHATIMARYARGVAHAALGEGEAATAELAGLNAEIEATDPAGENPAFAIARHALMGEIALRAGDAAGSIPHFRAAADLEDGMLYEEPPLWFYPIRHSLGRALLEAGRPAEAEAAYREDLARFPENGWSLFGLVQSLEAQGEDATAARAAFERAWAEADVELTASRF